MAITRHCVGKAVGVAKIGIGGMMTMSSVRPCHGPAFCAVDLVACLWRRASTAWCMFAHASGVLAWVMALRVRHMRAILFQNPLRRHDFVGREFPHVLEVWALKGWRRRMLSAARAPLRAALGLYCWAVAKALLCTVLAQMLLGRVARSSPMRKACIGAWIC
jgi:hypothetical protein